MGYHQVEKPRHVARHCRRPTNKYMWPFRLESCQDAKWEVGLEFGQVEQDQEVPQGQGYARVVPDDEAMR